MSRAHLPINVRGEYPDLYRDQVAQLTEALTAPGTRQEASEIIRGLLSEIRLLPNEGVYEIELVGELAGLLALGQKETASEACASGRSVSLVAGAGYQRYLHSLFRVSA